MCRGDAQSELEGRMICMDSIFSNSCLATASLSAKSGRARAKTGGPVVGTTCFTPWAGTWPGSKRGTAMAGKRAKVSVKQFSIREAATLVTVALFRETLSTIAPSERRKQLFRTSINIECLRKGQPPKLAVPHGQHEMSDARGVLEA